MKENNIEINVSEIFDEPELKDIIKYDKHNLPIIINENLTVPQQLYLLNSDIYFHEDAHILILALLKCSNFNINIKNNDGNTILMRIVSESNDENVFDTIVTILKHPNTYINAINKSGDTVLMLAAKQKNRLITNIVFDILLARNNIMINNTNIEKKTVIHILIDESYNATEHNIRSNIERNIHRIKKINTKRKMLQQ